MKTIGFAVARAFAVLALLLSVVSCAFDNAPVSRERVMSYEDAKKIASEYISIDRGQNQYVLNIPQEKVEEYGIPMPYISALSSELSTINSLIRKKLSEGSVVSMSTKHDAYTVSEAGEILPPHRKEAELRGAERFYNYVSGWDGWKYSTKEVEFKTVKPEVMAVAKTASTSNLYWYFSFKSSSGQMPGGGYEWFVTGTYNMSYTQMPFKHDSRLKQLPEYSWHFTVHVTVNTACTVTVSIHD